MESILRKLVAYGGGGGGEQKGQFQNCICMDVVTELWNSQVYEYHKAPAGKGKCFVKLDSPKAEWLGTQLLWQADIFRIYGKSMFIIQLFSVEQTWSMPVGLFSSDWHSTSIPSYYPGPWND